MRHKVFDKLYRFFSSPELTVAVMLYGVALSLAAVCFGAGNGGGFFECFFFTLDFGGLKIPIAGGSALGLVALANIFLGGLRFFKFGVAGLGASILHMAFALLIVSAALRHFVREEGAMTLSEVPTASVALSSGVEKKLPFEVWLENSEMKFRRGGDVKTAPFGAGRPASFAGWTFYKTASGATAVKNPARLLPWLATGASFFGMAAVLLPKFGRRGDGGR